MINKNILVIGNGGIGVAANGRFLSNPDTGKVLLYLKSQGFSPFYVSHRGDAIQNKALFSFDLKKNGIPFYSIKGGKKNPSYYLGMWKIYSQLKKSGSAYIYYPGAFDKMAARYAQKLKIPYGVYVRGYGLYQSNNNSDENIEAFNDDYILSGADYMVTVSPKLRSDLKDYCDDISILRPMIDMGLEDFSKKEKLKSKDEEWIFLFVGSLHERKGIYELCSAAEIIKKSGVKIRFKIVGDGPAYNDLVSKQKSGEIPDSIEFAGSISDKQKLVQEYENADAFILPSRNEGFPRVLYEAMIKGLPIFTTLVSGIAETMVPGYNCHELPVRKAEGMANVIINALNDIPELERFVINGHETVRTVLTERREHHIILADKALSLSK